jgi:hypothetical protein
VSDETIIVLAGMALMAFVVWLSRDTPRDAPFDLASNSSDWTHYTVTGPAEQIDGFTRSLHLYSRGPNDAPGNIYVWHCDECDRFMAQGHGPNCSQLKPGQQPPEKLEPQK